MDAGVGVVQSSYHDGRPRDDCSLLLYYLAAQFVDGYAIVYAPRTRVVIDVYAVFDPR